MMDVPSPTGQSHNNNNRRMALLEDAVNGVLSGNFDADSVVCLLTLMKVLDNVLQRPDDERVRSVRLANPTFQTKVVTKKGHFVLLACGFVSKRTQRPGAGGTGIGIGGNDNDNDTGDECLVLDPVHEDKAWIVEARSCLADVAVRQLGCDPKNLPVFVAPRARAVAVSNSSAPPTFDVYRGQRFDGQSASVGTDLGPPPGWKSDTERKLEQLERKKEALQRRIQGTDGPSSSSSSSDPTAAAAAMDRQWVAFLPGRPTAAATEGVVRSVAAMASAALLPSSSTSKSGGGTGTTTGGDGKLLAAHFQQQQQRRLAEADRGFTTKAMRDLERLQKSKVYSHAVVQAQFPDGTVVRGCFLPHETIRAVLVGIVRDVLLRPPAVPLPTMELYQAPPRRLLPADKSLQDLGLVPAAKVYVSWMSPLPVPVPVVRPQGGDVERGWFLRPELFRTTNDDDDSATPPTVTMPLSVPVVGGDAAIGNDGDGDGTKKAGTSSSGSNVNKRKMTKEEKEAALVARMLGGGRK